MSTAITHGGSCHCRAVRFEFDAPTNLVAFDCNCSICAMKCNVHAIVPASSFRLVAGEDHLSTYTFNTHTAKHKFCRVCGVQPFYIPRSNPDGIAVTIACITPGTVTQVNVQPFDGHNWDVSYTSSGIAKYSK